MTRCDVLCHFRTRLFCRIGVAVSQGARTRVPLPERGRMVRD